MKQTNHGEVEFMNNEIMTMEQCYIENTKNIDRDYTNTLTMNTKRSYMRAIKEFFNVKDLNDITFEQIQSVTPQMANEWAMKMVEEQGVTEATANGKLSAMHNFYAYLTRRSIGVAAYNPFDTSEGCIRFKNAQKDFSDKRAMIPDEVSKVFEAVKFPSTKYSTKYLIALRDLITLELLATTGMRRGEIVKIKIGDIVRNYGMWTCIIRGKGKKYRMIVIADGIKEHINEYISLRGLTYRDVDAPLITNHSSNYEENCFISEQTVYRIVKRYADKAGIGAEDISPHNFRHTYCTETLESGVDKAVVAQLMGHANISTTNRYDHSLRMLRDNPAEQLSARYGI